MDGVTEDGFVIKTYDAIIEEMKIQARGQFGNDVDLSATSPLMKFIESIALELYRVWEMAESLYYSGFLDTATDVSLDRVVRLLGITRIPAVRSTVTVRFSGSNGTIIPVDTYVGTVDGINFYTTESGTISGGYVDLACECVIYGDEGNVTSNVITVLVTFISGVTGVNNANPATGGEDVESDSDLRLRASLTLEGVGKATLAAIEAAILAIPGVIKANVYEDTINHSVEVILKGITPPNQTVDDALDASRAAGIPATWDNPTGIDIYISTTVSCTNPPSDAADQIEAKLVEHITNLDIGEDVIYSKLYDIIFNEFDWVDDVTVLLLDTVTPPVGTSNITIAYDEEAQTDVTKVVVTIA